MTALPPPRIRSPTCSAASIASTAFRGASSRHGIIAAPTASLRTDTMTPQMTSNRPADRKRAMRLAGALIGLSVALSACKTTSDEVTTASLPNDYRLRHPIAIQEADRSIVVFVGRGRGGLSASQRADVMYPAQTWLREGTRAISIDVPVNTPNARAAEDSLREIQATLAAAGVPPRATNVRQYHPEDPRHMAAIRLNYPKISAVAGPSRRVPPDPCTSV